MDVARSRQRSRRKGARVDPVDWRVEYLWGRTRKNGRPESALEVPQGAAVHPVSTPGELAAPARALKLLKCAGQGGVAESRLTSGISGERSESAACRG